jgi:hypothetical protein
MEEYVMVRKDDIKTVNRGDIVRFASYALRVDSEPKREANAITLHGRISIDGCPLVTKKFIHGKLVRIERAA